MLSGFRKDSTRPLCRLVSCLFIGGIVLVGCGTSKVAESNAQGAWPPLHQAVLDQDANQVKSLIESGVSVNLRARGIRSKDDPSDDQEITPLMLAAKAGDVNIENILIDQKADLDAKDWRGRNALWFAAQDKDPNAALTLIHAGANVNAAADDGTTPLAIAESDDVVSALLAKGANPSVGQPLCSARTVGIAWLLIQHGAEINSDRSPLSAAIQDNRIDVAKFLIDQGARLSVHSGNTMSPFSLAVFYATDTGIKQQESEGRLSNHPDAALLESMISHGADVNEVGVNAKTPLMTVASSGDQPDLADLLLNHGAKVDMENGDEYTALDWAVTSDQPRVAETLLRHGADVRHRSSGGYTPLMLVSLNCDDPRMAELLINSGAPADEADKMGFTALHYAANLNRPKVLEMLMKHGANTRLKTKSGYTPLEIAKATKSKGLHGNFSQVISDLQAAESKD